MKEKIAIICPECSASLSAPPSAKGRTLLCPKCRTGIPVPRQREVSLVAISEQTTVDLHSKQHGLTEGLTNPRKTIWSNRSPVLRRLAAGLAVLLTIGLMIWGSEQLRIYRKANAIEAALVEKDFDKVLILEPNHVEALIGRAGQQLELPQTNVEGAVRDLKQLQRLVPDHPIHTEILPALSVARSMEHAAAGRTAAAILELKEAATLGATEPQLEQLRQSIITAFLKQARVALQDKRYDQALANCDEVLRLGGNILQVSPILRQAWASLSQLATTADELDRAIQALETLPEAGNSPDVAENLRQLHFRRTQLAHSEGDLDAAASHFLRLVEYGPLDADVLHFGEALTRTAIAAFEAESSKQNFDRALQIIKLLDDSVLDSVQFVLLKLTFAGFLLASADSDEHDRHLEFSVRNVRLAQSKGMPLEQHQSLIKTLTFALVERSIERFRQGKIQEASDDVRTAIDVDPTLTRPLVARLRQATLTIREQLPLDLLFYLRNGEQDDILTVIPAAATAFSVIRNMESYSDKIDRIAELMELPAPRLLEENCNIHLIHDGLNREGSLGWVKMPVPVAAPGFSGEKEVGNLFLLETTDFLKMIEMLHPSPDGDLQRVTMIDARAVQRNSPYVERSGLAAPLGSFGAFAFENDRNTLNNAVNDDGDIRSGLEPHGIWAADLDAYFLLTQQGLINGLQNFDIPFQSPRLQTAVSFIQIVAPRLLQQVDLLPDEWRPKQLAIGLAVDPDQGIAVRSRSWFSPDVDLTGVFSENPGGRELALKLLPDAPFLIALGGPISANQSQWITSRAGQFLPPQKELDIHISSVQAVLLAPEPVQKGAEDLARNKELWDASFGFVGGLIFVVTVEDAEAALLELETLFAAVAESAANPATQQHHIFFQKVKLEGINVLLVNSALNGENYSIMRIAATGQKTLVFAAGGDEQLAWTLDSLRGDANLSGSETVRTAVRMLPESTSWVAVVDLKNVVPLAIRAYPGDRSEQQANELLTLVGDMPLPLALGLSWEQSVLDVDLSLPKETLPFLGRILSFRDPILNQ